MRYRSCPCCGEVNLMTAAKCWDCFAALPAVPPCEPRSFLFRQVEWPYPLRKVDSSSSTARQELRCLCCGETNPVESVVCWACYTPVHAPFLQSLKYKIETLRPSRLFKSRRPDTIEDDTLFGDDPIAQILWMIVKYAVKDRAGEILVEPQVVETPVDTIKPQLRGHSAVFGEKGLGVRVLFRTDAMWHEEMKIPAYILEPLYADVRSRCAPQPQKTGDRIDFFWQGLYYNLKVNFIPVDCGEMLSLTFQ